MQLIDKATIIVDFWEFYSSKPAWKNFFEYHDMGVPYSIGITNGDILSLGPHGEQIIQETWQDLCRSAGVDVDGDYANIGDFVMAAAGERV